MHVYGINMPSGSKVETSPMDSARRGTAFPSNPAHLDLFEIVEGGVPAVGVYAYNLRTTQWVLIHTVSFPYDIGLSIAGKPEAAKTVAMVIVVRPTVLPANFQGSIASCDVNATANASFSIKLNGTQIGTIAFAAGNGVATFTGPASDIVCVPGDKLTVTSPVVADSTLSYVAATLLGHQLAA